MKKDFKINDRVTGVEGRDSCGWHGVVKAIDTTADGHPFYRVHWQERADDDGMMSRCPILAMRGEHIRLKV